MGTILQGAGWFIYPLGLAWFVALFIMIERYLVLRKNCRIPVFREDILEHYLDTDFQQKTTVFQRMLRFYRRVHPDENTLQSFILLEISHLQRGFFLLEVVITAAPLLGLLGTVTGLIQVFGNVSVETSMPSSASFVSGISLAMTTTMLGLIIAIPTLVVYSYFVRKVESFYSQIEVYATALLNAPARKNAPKSK